MARAQFSHLMSTFGDMTKSYIMQVQSCFRFTDTVVDVFGCYDTEHSIQSAERHRRSATRTTQNIYHIDEGRTVPDWKKFLSSNKNKQALINFLGDSLSSNLSDMFQEENKCLVLAGVFSNPEIVRQLSDEHTLAQVLHHRQHHPLLLVTRNIQNNYESQVMSTILGIDNVASTSSIDSND
ncbi:hypothetical protein AM593_05240, partial [Mytilus galloprovincialis]